VLQVDLSCGITNLAGSYTCLAGSASSGLAGSCTCLGGSVTSSGKADSCTCLGDIAFSSGLANIEKSRANIRSPTNSDFKKNADLH